VSGEKRIEEIGNRMGGMLDEQCVGVTGGLGG